MPGMFYVVNNIAQSIKKHEIQVGNLGAEWILQLFFPVKECLTVAYICPLSVALGHILRKP